MTELEESPVVTRKAREMRSQQGLGMSQAFFICVVEPVVYVFVHYLPLSSYLRSNISQPHLIYITLVHVQATTWNPFQGIAEQLNWEQQRPKPKRRACLSVPTHFDAPSMHERKAWSTLRYVSKQVSCLTGSIYSHLGLNCSHVLLHERGENTTVTKRKGFRWYLISQIYFGV